MLNIFIRDEFDPEDKSINYVRDVDEAFSEVSIPDSPVNRKLINSLECGEYKDEFSYIDRFGDKVRIEDMSTGCKAALLISSTNSIVDIIECGVNARDLIIKHIKNGSLVMSYPSRTIAFDDNDIDIDVRIGKYRITNIPRLNYYLFNEYPFNPDLSRCGIEVLDDV